MKILVAVKRVIDPYVKIRVKPEHTGVETDQVKMSMNPFDEIAVEASVRLKEQGIASECVAVSIGPVACQETLRTALALGCDRAIHVQTEEALFPLHVAQVLHKLCEQEKPLLILMGKQSIDGDNNQTGQMLAALLGIAQGTYASELQVSEGSVRVVREIDGGLQTLTLTLPAVITTDLRLNQPRYATLPNIMKARQKPLQVLALSDLELTLEKHVTLVKVVPPSLPGRGVLLGSVAELVDKLRNEAKVL